MFSVGDLLEISHLTVSQQLGLRAFEYTECTFYKALWPYQKMLH